MFNLTPAVRALLLANLVLFLLQNQLPLDQLELYNFVSPYFKPWQPLTYMFLHGSWGHWFGNMLSLFFFGGMLEQKWGTPRFLLFYLVCGVGAGLAYNGVRAWELHEAAMQAQQFLDAPSALRFARFMEHYGQGYEYAPLVDALRQSPTNPDIMKASVRVVTGLLEVVRDSPMLGASGAVFGILFAFGYLFPNTYLYIYFAFPIKAKYFVFLYGAYELWNGTHRVAGDNVAHFAHLGGMVFAFLLLKYWERTNPDFY